MKKIYLCTILSEDKPGVLYRVADIFLRRKINIEGIISVKNKEEKLSKISIFVEETQEAVDKTIRQIDRIIEVVNAVAKVASIEDIKKFMKAGEITI